VDRLDKFVTSAAYSYLFSSSMFYYCFWFDWYEFSDCDGLEEGEDYFF